jgi:translocation and assembly module TamA
MRLARTPFGAPPFLFGALLSAWAPCEAQSRLEPVANADAVDPGDLDPSADMAPLPEMEVEWPDAQAGPGLADEMPSGAGDPGQSSSAEEAEALADAQADRPYDVRIDGLSGQEGVTPDAEASIRARFKSLSALEEGKGTGNTAQIDRRARQDEALLNELLRTAGYYDASVVTRIEGQRGERLSVVLRVRAGTVYTLSSVEMAGLSDAGPLAPELRAAFGLREGEPADSDRIATGLAALKTNLGQRGLVFAKVGDPKLTIDHEEHQASLSIDVDPGRVQRIGEIRVDGRQLFSAKHLGRIARFRRGDV